MVDHNNTVAAAKPLAVVSSIAPLPLATETARKKVVNINAKPFEPKPLKPRPWIYGRSHLRNYLSAVIAPGGVGKSRLMTIEALSMATGKEIGGKWVKQGLKVWLWNLEDEETELNNCIVSAANHYRIKPSDYAGRLFVNDGSHKLCIARQEAGVTVVSVESETALIDEIRSRSIDALIIDPFISSHGLPENDNNAIQQAVDAWKRVARSTNCSITLVHHSRKSNGQKTTADSARGASSLTSAARIVRVMDRMPAVMAKEHDLDGSRYFSVGSDKPNLTPNGRGHDWYTCISAPLPTEEIGAMPDSVGVAVIWTPPDAFADVTVDMAKQAWGLIGQTEIARAAPTANDWVGYAIAKLWGWECDSQTKAKLKRILKSWEGNTIKIGTHKDTSSGKDWPVYVSIPHLENEVGV